jgi:S-adenosylmethionine:tRNA ribosyltransferase-isomerase
LDKRRYQTVFADKEGAIAAPTAGLHFTKQLISRIKKTGAQVCFLTLHVNYATFSPVRCDDVSEHVMEEESVEIPESTVEALRRAKGEGARVFCVGTTVCKALEDNACSILEKKRDGAVTNMSKLFIYPPFNFKIVDCMITNFHLPRTTLLMLVSAFAGKDLIFKAYKEALENEYRFYSYGDGMLIL